MKKYIVWLSSITVLAIATLAILQLQIKGLGDKLNRQGAVIDSMQHRLDELKTRDAVLLDSIRQLSVHQAPDSSLLPGEQEAVSEAAPTPARQPASYDAPPRPDAARPPAPSAAMAGSYEARKGVALKGGARFDVFKVDPKKADIVFYHKDGGQVIGSIQRLKSLLQREARKLVFATNGGMFRKNLSPTGLYVEGGVEFYPLNLSSGGGAFTNFYSIPPNGVFYLTRGKTAGIVKKEDYPSVRSGVAYATQSGPMAVIDGRINPRFRKGSSSKYIRSGVGVRTDGLMVFAISQQPVTFYDFARIFIYYGCQDALYLDGGISEMYLPEIGRRNSANEFALMIAITEKM